MAVNDAKEAIQRMVEMTFDETKKGEREHVEQDTLKFGHVTNKDMQEQKGIRYGNVSSEDDKNKFQADKEVESHNKYGKR